MNEREPLVIITSKVHVPRVRAPQILMNHGYERWFMVVDNVEQRVRAMNELGIPHRHLVHTNKPEGLGQDGIAWTREWVERTLVQEGQWYVTLDDNVGGWTHLPAPWCVNERLDFDVPPKSTDKTWRELFETPCPFPTVVTYWQELMAMCQVAGTEAGGFAIETNYFFRARKWQRLGYVRAQNAVWKNSGRPFYYWKGAMLEDFIRSVDVVARCGSIVINRFVKPIKKFFEAGGIGTFEERRPNLVDCSNKLLEKYPGLVRRNKGQDYQLTFVHRTLDGVNRWRREHGYL